MGREKFTSQIPATVETVLTQTQELGSHNKSSKRLTRTQLSKHLPLHPIIHVCGRLKPGTVAGIKTGIWNVGISPTGQVAYA